MNELTHYIVLGTNCWGRSTNDEDALRNCVRNLSWTQRRAMNSFVCFHVSEDTRINGLGGFDRPQNAPEAVRYWDRNIPGKIIEEYKEASDALIYGNDEFDVTTVYADSNN